MFEIPYNRSELRSAVMSLNKISDEEADAISDRISEKFEPMEDKKELNKRIADDNGITVLELINSNNYEILKNEFMKSFTIKFISYLEKEGLTNVQAWAVIASALGINVGLN